MSAIIYSPILDSELDANSPLTTSLAFRWRDNPIAIIEGSSAARSAGLGVFIAKSPDGILPAQTGVLTDATDPSLILTPDGLGSVQWTEKEYCSATLLPDGSTWLANNMTTDADSGSGVVAVFGSKALIQEVVASRLLFAMNILITISGGSGASVLKLLRKRGSTYTTLWTSIVYNSEADDFGTSSPLNITITDSLNGDAYILGSTNGISFTTTPINNSFLSISSIN